MPIAAPREGLPVIDRFEEKGGNFKMTPYIGGREEPGPHAFLIHDLKTPGFVQPHFHNVRQFQVVISRGARLGKHPVPGISFHYADPYTPYGPIVPGDEDPLAFFTLRPEGGAGIYYMPGSRDQMPRKAGRNIARQVPPAAGPASGCETLIEREEDGLAAFRLRLGPDGSRHGPPPEGSGGQYYLVMDGSLKQEDKDLDRLSLMFVTGDEEPPLLEAGSQGVDLLVLQFPVKTY